MDHREVFRENELIYVQGQWKASGDCVWTGPKCLTSKVALKEEYPLLTNLFKEILRIGDATSQTLLDDLVNTISRTGFAIFDRVGGLVLEIGRRLPSESAKFAQHLKRSINDRSCLPVRSSNSPSMSLVAPSKVDGFFLADREYLYHEFKDQVPILDFTLDELHSIEVLIDLFYLDKRRLS